MPEAARLGDSVSTGHGCDATTTIQGNLTSKVYINGIIAAVKGDVLAAHTIPSGPICVGHTAYINIGRSKVFIEGIEAARKDDSADAGAVTGHSPNVNFGG